MPRSRTPPMNRPGSPRIVQARVREQQVLAQRVRSVPVAEIAADLKISEAAVRNAIKRAMDRIPSAEAREMRMLQWEQIQDLYRPAAELAHNPPPLVGRDGHVLTYVHEERDETGAVIRSETRTLIDWQAQVAGIDRCIKLQERAAKLFGTDAAVKFQLGAPETQRVATVDELAVRIRAIQIDLNPAAIEAVTRDTDAV